MQDTLVVHCEFLKMIKKLYILLNAYYSVFDKLIS